MTFATDPHHLLHFCRQRRVYVLRDTDGNEAQLTPQQFVFLRKVILDEVDAMNGQEPPAWNTTKP